MSALVSEELAVDFACCVFLLCFLFLSLLDPADESSMILRNMGGVLLDYVALCP
jgi:hypothetical protein